MAINPLYGYDTTQYGYGQANGYGQAGQGGDTNARRRYPAWMTDQNARGIGVAQSFTPAAVPFIDIPRGDGAPVVMDAPRPEQPRPEQPTFDRGSTGNVGEGSWSNPGAAFDGIGGTMDALGGDLNSHDGPASGDFAGQMAGLNAMYHGGVVTRNRLRGPDPAGPDDGYAALDVGEGVLTAKALKYYGDGIVARMNKLQVPKGAFGKR